MMESAECIVKVGFRKSPRKIFDEVETVTADMVRQGWSLKDTVVEEGLGNIHIFFEREIASGPAIDSHQGL
jgi:hypothetical protein